MSAAPKRGKFLSQPQPSTDETAGKPSSTSSKPATPRGKTLGKTLTSPSSAHSSSAQGGTHGYNDNNSLSNLATVVNEAKKSASARRKEVSAKRDRLFNDLDQAENIILSLLDCASDVANSLSEMTTAKVNGNANSFEDLSSRIRENGVGYLAGVKKLHSLLAPHASLVKSYRHQDDDASVKSEKEPATSVNEKEPALSDVIVKKATSNMYAARVEKRLALERSSVLREMIRLEELESSENDAAATVGEDTASGSKRKHETIE
jgi:hypothetical protein